MNKIYSVEFFRDRESEHLGTQILYDDEFVMQITCDNPAGRMENEFYDPVNGNPTFVGKLDALELMEIICRFSRELDEARMNGIERERLQAESDSNEGQATGNSMETFKIESFEKNHGRGTCPQYRTMSPSGIKRLQGSPGNRLKLGSPTDGRLLIVTTQTYRVTVGASATIGFLYDANGSSKSCAIATGTATYEWDTLDCLTAIDHEDDTRSEFEYDGLSRRVRIIEKDALATITSDKHFVWNGLAIAEERAADGQTVLKRFFPQGVEILTGPSAGTYTYRTDHLGSVREVIDSTGALTARYDYTAWGELQPVSGAFDLDFGYTGHYRHQPSALWLAPFRAYDPQAARWLSRDPIQEDGGLNLYEYCFEDPINLSDSDGLYPGQGTIRKAGAASAAGALKFWKALAKSFKAAPKCKPAEAPLDRASQAARMAKNRLARVKARAKALEKDLPTLDRTGKVHGKLPKPRDFGRHDPDDLRHLKSELEKSVRRRIRVTTKLGRDRPHGQRQCAEQDLIKSLEK